MIGPDSSFILLKNGLPKVTIFSTKQSSSYGNKIEIYGRSGEIIFKPTITCKMEYSITGVLELYRSTSQNGTYTSLLPGVHGNGTYNPLTSSYYYQASGGASSFYLKDTAGSAVQFVE